MSFNCLCFFPCFLAQIQIQAESGQDVPLTCQIPDKNNRSVMVSKCGDEKMTVYLFRGGQFDEDSQHPSFKNRVILNESNRNGGNLSLTLKNVTTADSGTYLARALHENTWIIFCVFNLNVSETGEFRCYRFLSGSELIVDERNISHQMVLLYKETVEI